MDSKKKPLRIKLKVCSKCHVTPTVERTELDGITQLKVSCPICGLAYYTPIGGKLDARECWNSRNPKRSKKINVHHNLVCPTSCPTPRGFTSDQCTFTDKGHLLSAGEYGTDYIDDFVF